MNLQTESIQVTGLATGTIAALEELGRAKGKSSDELLREMIEIQVLAQRPFDEILAPMRQGFQMSGLDEEGLDALFAEAREEAYQERLARQ